MGESFNNTVQNISLDLNASISSLKTLVERNTKYITLIFLIGIIVIVVFFMNIDEVKVFHPHTKPLKHVKSLETISTKNQTRNSIFQNIRAGAIVFYGRQRYVQILNCYLERNLIDNGGVLQEIIFVAKTNNKADLAYLDSLIASHPKRYSRKNVTNLGWSFDAHYKGLNPEQYYFKIDDDIVYIHEGALEHMLEAKIQNPDVLFVSANVINHPVLASVHGQMRAFYNISRLANISGEDPNCAWNSANCGSIQHESFLKHIHDKSLHYYIFNQWDFNWKNQYPRWSINLILFQGKDVRDVTPGDDEHQISIVIPSKQKRHSIAVGAAVAVHFAYIPQRNSGMVGAREAYFVGRYANLSRTFCVSSTKKDSNK